MSGILLSFISALYVHLLCFIYRICLALRSHFRDFSGFLVRVMFMQFRKLSLRGTQLERKDCLRQTDRQTDRQRDRETERQTDPDGVRYTWETVLSQ